MKKIILLCVVLLTAHFGWSQQTHLNTQYLFNEMLINPGATGSKDYIPIQFGFRKQWVNFPGSPTSQSLTAHSKIANNMGFGGAIFNAIAGPSRITGVAINGAYHLRLDKQNKHKLGLGIGVKFSQHYIDEDKLTTYLPSDPAIKRGFYNHFVPDVNFGAFYYYDNKAFAGFSIKNIVEGNIDLYRFNESFTNSLSRTYYLYGGYDFRVGPRSRIRTRILGRIIDATPFQVELTALYEWDNLFWVGAAYRYSDAVSGLIGVHYKMIRLGYSYDFTLSDIGDYSYGSHEVFLELQLFTKWSESRTPWLKRNRIYSPSL